MMYFRLERILTCQLNYLFFVLLFLCALFPALSQYVWTQSPTTSAQEWNYITCDLTGQYLLASTNPGDLFTSNDFGQTWTVQGGSTYQKWYGVASNSTGDFLVATVYGGGIYTSTTFGVTWTQTSAINANWVVVTSDYVGKHLAVVAYGGSIYTSSDSGSTWSKSSAPVLNWYSICSDKTGKYLVAGVWNGYLYTSFDYGSSWTERISVYGFWNSVASNATGGFVAAVNHGGYIYTSTNYGVTWEVSLSIVQQWNGIASDSTGRYLAASTAGYIYTSSNYGVTWVQNSAPSVGYNAIASDSTGTHLYAIAVPYGYTYTAYPVPTSTPTSEPSSRPSIQPTSSPTNMPSCQPTSKPSHMPSQQPTSLPSQQPSAEPSAQPSTIPTDSPSNQPSSNPTDIPTSIPTVQPTNSPTMQPYAKPTSGPSSYPSAHPSNPPTNIPTNHPSNAPTDQPSSNPTIQPTLQPSTQPSCYPTSQPTQSPTDQPSRQPTETPTSTPSESPSSQPLSQPSSSPTVFPTTQPSRQPSSIPTVNPSTFPTSQPTSQPSQMPSQQPTSSPSQQPSAEPSAQPSTKPTDSPTNQPSSNPTDIPTSIPTVQPTNSPTVNPSTCPTSQPSRSPSTQPSKTPTACPTTKPSGSPTSPPSCQPSSSPTSLPTLAPTRLLKCPAGHYLVKLPNEQLCLPCAIGFAAEEGANVCTMCEAGYFASSAFNASSCEPCPFNSYQPAAAQTSCISCGSGYVTGAIGSILKSDCVNPTSSFIAGFIFSGLSAVIMGPYLFRGRLQRIAFSRKERLVKKLITIAGATSRASDLLSAVNQVIVLIKRESKTKRFCSYQQWRRIKIMMFVIFSILITAGMIILTVLVGIAQILFNVMILFRSFNGYVGSLKPIEDTIEIILNSVLVILHLEFLRPLLYPLVYVINLVSNIRINLDVVQVSCAGAQGPALLLINILIVGIVIIVIRSEIQSYWSVAQERLLFKVLCLPFNNSFVGKNKLSTLLYVLTAAMMFILPTPCKIIQYSMSFVTAMWFFDDHGRSKSNVNCDAAFSFPLDSFLATVTTIFVYVALPPIIYMLSQVIVPSFKLGQREFPVFQLLRQCCQQIKSNYSGDSQHKINRITSRNRETSVDVVEMASMVQINKESSNTLIDVKLVFAEYIEKRQSSMSFSGRVLSLSTEARNHCDTFESGTDDKATNCHRKQFSRFTRYASLLFALDWLYMKLVSSALVSIFESYRRFLKYDHLKPYYNDKNMIRFQDDYERVQTTRLQMKVANIPKIPWFLVVEDDMMTKQEKALEKEKELQHWKIEKLKFPNFSMASLQVRYEMRAVLDYFLPDASCIRRILKYFLKPFTYPASFIICFQLMTDIGRAIWQRVIMNYLSVIIMSFGCWLDYMVSDFDIFSDYERFLHSFFTVDKEMREEVMRFSSSMRLSMLESRSDIIDDLLDVTNGSFSPETFWGTNKEEIASINKRLIFQDKGEALVKFTNDPKVLFQRYLASVVQVRVVLLQIVPAFTFWSVVAVDLASCPIFVFSEDIYSNIPPLLVTNPLEVARELLKEDSLNGGREDVEHWKIMALGFNLFVLRSRFIQFCFTLLNTVVALLIVLDYSTELMFILLYIVIIEFVVVGCAFSLQLILLLHRYLFPLEINNDQVLLQNEPNQKVNNSEKLQQEQPKKKKPKQQENEFNIINPVRKQLKR